MLKDFFPVKVILQPAETFSGIAAGKTGWGRPLGLYAFSIAASAFLLSVLPPQFIAESFEGAALPQGRGFWFYLGISLPGGLLFSVFTCALLSAAAVFLRTGRLSLRLPLAALGVGVYGILAAALHNSAGLRPAGIAAALAAVGFAFRAALRNKKTYSAALKAVLALAAITILADLAGGAAALAGSVKVYAASAYFFSLASLIWLAKAAAAIYDTSRPRAMAAAVLAVLGSAAFLFLLFNLRLLPPGVFQVLMLAS
jgi:drug/metabolite transporter superfamily protein YnfA